VATGIPASSIPDAVRKAAREAGGRVAYDVDARVWIAGGRDGVFTLFDKAGGDSRSVYLPPEQATEFFPETTESDYGYLGNIAHERLSGRATFVPPLPGL
jgi:hypothetical protein